MVVVSAAVTNCKQKQEMMVVSAAVTASRSRR